jgi:hypothetical protein
MFIKEYVYCKTMASLQVIKKLAKEGGDVVLKNGGKQPLRFFGGVLKNTWKASTGAAKNFAKGAGGSALKVAGYTTTLTAAAAVPTISAIKIYDYLGDVRAKTDFLRQYDITLDLMDRENEIQKNREDIIKDRDTNPFGADNATINYILEGQQAERETSANASSNVKTITFGAVALVLIGGALFVYSKKRN